MKNKSEGLGNVSTLAGLTFLAVFIAAILLLMMGYAYVLRLFFLEYLKAPRVQGIEYLFYGAIYYSHVIILCPLLPLNVLLFGGWGRKRLPRLRRLSTGSKISLFLLPIAVCFILDMTNYTVVTKDGAILRSYASLSTLHKTWQQVARVETGCYYTGGKGAHLSLEYRLYFDDGKSINVFDTEANGDVLVNLQEVDTILRALNVPFYYKRLSFWINAGGIYINQRCFTELKNKYASEAEYSKIIKLLRLDQWK